jgi:hypothetical protein
MLAPSDVVVTRDCPTVASRVARPDQLTQPSPSCADLFHGNAIR